MTCYLGIKKNKICVLGSTVILPKIHRFESLSLFLFSIVLSPHLAQDCSADDDNFLVPIAVGAALAGVLILVLLAYFIGLKRHHAGYEQF